MQDKAKVKKKKDALSSRPYVRRKESEMIKISNEIQTGLLSIRGACLKYGICRGTLKAFITVFDPCKVGQIYENRLGLNNFITK